jgi:CRP-like cAMP-binding protein
MEKSIPDLLAEHAFFHELSSQALALLAGCAKNVHFEAGRYIAHEGDEALTFYALRRGRVAVQVHSPEGGTLVVQTLGVGEVLGWSWLFPPHRWRFDAVALEPTSAVEFDGACLRGKCENDAAIGFPFVRRFAQVIVQQLEAARLQLMDIYGRSNPP